MGSTCEFWLLKYMLQTGLDPFFENWLKSRPFRAEDTSRSLPQRKIATRFGSGNPSGSYPLISLQRPFQPPRVCRNGVRHACSIFVHNSFACDRVCCHRWSRFCCSHRCDGKPNVPHYKETWPMDDHGGQLFGATPGRPC